MTMPDKIVNKIKTKKEGSLSCLLVKRTERSLDIDYNIEKNRRKQFAMGP